MKKILLGLIIAVLTSSCGILNKQETVNYPTDFDNLEQWVDVNYFNEEIKIYCDTINFDLTKVE
jgi:hypothetical protein